MVYFRGEFIEGHHHYHHNNNNNTSQPQRLITVVGSPVCAQTAHTLIIHKLKLAAAASMED